MKTWSYKKRTTFIIFYSSIKKNNKYNFYIYVLSNRSFGTIDSGEYDKDFMIINFPINIYCKNIVYFILITYTYL